MSSYKSEFMRTMEERGFLHQLSNADGLDELCASETVTAYIGFDCTASSLHVGSLVQIMMLHWFQQSGHRAITLMGSGTTRVGDPTGKDESRKVLTDENIEDNKNGIKQVFEKFLTFGDGPSDAMMMDNADWLLKLNYMDFLRDVGRYFSVNQMIQRDSVKLRLEREQHLSFLEFNYMLLQGYDYLEIHRRTGCRLQMGGSDQWSNILSGVDLGRRLADKELFALTTPLLTTASGAKMGKTAAGAVWLNADMLSPYDYWQFWRNTEDADVEKFLKLFTVLPMDEIKRLGALSGTEINDAKKVLATEATALLHGREEAEKAAETARKAFEEGANAAGLPTIEVPQAELEAGIGVLGLYVTAGLCSSNGETRRNLKGGGVRINDKAEQDHTRTITIADLTNDGVIKLSLGKKKHVLVKPA
ncbi:Tyrosine--tRNA ligase [Pseudovibrio axinellae]|uniref:Tyrosine--tRNA ligase n=1 Tax=Pseudovibrio axinellae TaxID=989403 RepID=A0A161VCC9_9HYPH|nr:tyrosine--tRNA ligase [Pseudovibrio axinellae]KZL21836.1 Tyrosine--tRNA ligase [Pseudovibrio axinellae]SEQ80281.1 tyrosyl-tRNA synthetase [Pseudovibrio axinellae]